MKRPPGILGNLHDVITAAHLCASVHTQAPGSVFASEDV